MQQMPDPQGGFVLMTVAGSLQKASDTSDLELGARMMELLLTWRYRYPGGFDLDDPRLSGEDENSDAEQERLHLMGIIEQDRNLMMQSVAHEVARNQTVKAFGIAVGYCDGDVQKAKGFLLASVQVGIRGLRKRGLMRALPEELERIERDVFGAFSND